MGLVQVHLPLLTISEWPGWSPTSSACCSSDFPHCTVPEILVWASDTVPNTIRLRHIGMVLNRIDTSWQKTSGRSIALPWMGCSARTDEKKGHKFCVMRSWIFQEVWVTDFACLGRAFRVRCGSRVWRRVEGSGARGRSYALTAAPPPDYHSVPGHYELLPALLLLLYLPLNANSALAAVPYNSDRKSR